jgi:hypothetical protein
MFARDVYSEFQQWANSLLKRKSILEVFGPPSVGKTTIVKSFVKDYFEKYYWIDLSTASTLRICCRESSSSVESVIATVCPGFVDEVGSVIVFDEVSRSSKVYNWLSDMLRKFKCSIIAISSNPSEIAGNKFKFLGADAYVVRMNTMTLAEVMGVYGVREYYDEACLKGTSPAYVYDIVRKFYDMYHKTGGYPAVVNAVSSSNAFNTVNNVMGHIVTNISTHLGLDGASDVLKSVAKLRNNADTGNSSYLKKLGSSVNEYVRPHLEYILESLCSVGILGCCDRYCSEDLYVRKSGTRYHFMDVGLAYYFYKQSNSLTSWCEGCLAEDFAYRCMLDVLRKMGSNLVPCYGLVCNGEIDFLSHVYVDGVMKSLAIEIKSGNSTGKTASAIMRNNIVDKVLYARLVSNGGYNCSEGLETISLPLLGRIDLNVLLGRFVGKSRMLPKDVDKVLKMSSNF